MTTQVIMGNGYGAAIASDSAVTVGGRYVHETSEKLVCLDAPHSVVALVSGAVDQYGLPVQVLLNEWKSRLGNSRLRTVGDYRENFLSWYRSNVNDFPIGIEHEQFVFWQIDNHLRNWWRQSSGHEENETLEQRTGAVSALLEREVDDHLALEKIDRFNDSGGDAEIKRIIDHLWVARDGVWPGLEERIRYWFDDIEPEQLSDVCERFRRLLELRASTWSLFGPITSVVFAGFGDRDLVVSTADVALMGGLGSFVSTFQYPTRQAVAEGNSYWFIQTAGQAEYIDNILRGYRQDVVDTVVQRMRAQAAPQVESDQVQFDLGLPDNSAALAGELWSAFKDESESRFLQPLRDAVSAMPLKSLAEAVRSLVGVEALGKVISGQLPTTGGAIEVVVVTRSEGILRLA